MALKLITAPASEPLNLAVEVKPHLRVDFSDDDVLLLGTMKAAREYIERKYLCRALISQTWDLYLDSWPDGDCIEIPRPPLQSITGVYYTLDTGVEQTFASSNYIVDTVNEPGRVVLKAGSSWPSETLQVVNGVRVRFVAGYGASGGDVPAPIKQALLLTVADLYENRENTIVAQATIQKLPFGVEALLTPYRIIHF